MTIFFTPRASVVIIQRDDKVLILKRSPDASSYPNFWNFPGGRVEDMESPIAAAIREIQEETNLIIFENDLEYLGSCDFTFKMHYFKTARIQGEVELNHESSDFAWVKLHDILDMTFIPIPSQILEKVAK